MNDLVAEEGYQQRANSNDDDAGVAWHIIVDRVNQLGANDRVHSRPAEAGKDVKYSNCNKSVGRFECKGLSTY